MMIFDRLDIGLLLGLPQDFSLDGRRHQAFETVLHRRPEFAAERGRRIAAEADAAGKNNSRSGRKRLLRLFFVCQEYQGTGNHRPARVNMRRTVRRKRAQGDAAFRSVR